MKVQLKITFEEYYQYSFYAIVQSDLHVLREPYIFSKILTKNYIYRVHCILPDIFFIFRGGENFFKLRVKLRWKK